MNLQEALSLTTFTLGAFGVVFTVYNYFRNPQIKSDKTDSLLEQRLASLEASVVNIRDNHLHTLDVKIDAQKDAMGLMALQVERLSTIIDERIPKRVL